MGWQLVPVFFRRFEKRYGGPGTLRDSGMDRSERLIAGGARLVDGGSGPGPELGGAAERGADWVAPVAILRALGRAVWRDLSTFRSLAGNNFALFAALLMMQPEAAQFFVLLLALLLLGPLSSDPLGRVPAVRFG